MPDGVRYHLIRADVEDCPPIPRLIFDDPAEAAEAARQLSRERGEKLMVKPVINPKWRIREQQRIKDGTYRPLPWDRLDWWCSDMVRAVRKDHYPHPSIERPGWLAYTKNDEDGTLDKQTIVRPGSYLKQYFSQSLSYYGLNERQVVSMFMEAFGPLDIHFTTNEAEIVATYENGPETCMRVAGRRWPGGINPAHVYAAGDLQVAYLGDLEDCSARAIVWPEKKLYSRVYGDIARLTRGLEREGYKWGAPIGARVKKVKLQDVVFDPKVGVPAACFNVPYIDKKNQRGGGHLAVIEKEDHLIICEDGTPGSHHCGMADGHSGQYVPRQDEFPTFTCDNCGRQGFRELTTVLTAPEDGEEKCWCTQCCRAYGFHCGYSGNWFPANVARAAVAGAIWAQYYADMYAKICDMTSKMYPEQQVHAVCFPDGTVKNMGPYYAERVGGITQSTKSGRFYLRTDMIRVYDRKYGAQYIGKPEAKYFAFQCDGCDLYWEIDERKQSCKDDRLFCVSCNRQIKEDGIVPVSASRQQAGLRYGPQRGSVMADEGSLDEQINQMLKTKRNPLNYYNP